MGCKKGTPFKVKALVLGTHRMGSRRKEGGDSVGRSTVPWWLKHTDLFLQNTLKM